AITDDVLGTATVAMATAGNTSTSGNLKAGSYTGAQSVTALSGSDAANYTYTGLTGDYTVNTLALNAAIAIGSSTYGSSLSTGSLSFTNKVSGDDVTG
ncbi:MAG: hypothetical protein JZU63_08990, partial [Rhodoferax sp.]|nr:hypothetical protein [Rhodoferax sp.]